MSPNSTYETSITLNMKPDKYITILKMQYSIVILSRKSNKSYLK